MEKTTPLAPDMDELAILIGMLEEKITTLPEWEPLKEYDPELWSKCDAGYESVSLMINQCQNKYEEYEKRTTQSTYPNHPLLRHRAGFLMEIAHETTTERRNRQDLRLLLQDRTAQPPVQMER